MERERLLSALDGALASPLTLLSAPAGWGKTTLLSAWASRHKAQIAWLSLDELDTSPTRFWLPLIAALRGCPSLTPQLGDTVVALLQSPQPPLFSSTLTALLHELESRTAHSAPIVLIVDDYQVIEDPAIHQSMAFFLEHLPAPRPARSRGGNPARQKRGRGAVYPDLATFEAWLAQHRLAVMPQ